MKTSGIKDAFLKMFIESEKNEGSGCERLIQEI